MGAYVILSFQTSWSSRGKPWQTWGAWQTWRAKGTHLSCSHRGHRVLTHRKMIYKGRNGPVLSLNFQLEQKGGDKFDFPLAK